MAQIVNINREALKAFDRHPQRDEAAHELLTISDEFVAKVRPILKKYEPNAVGESLTLAMLIDYIYEQLCSYS